MGAPVHLPDALVLLPHVSDGGAQQRLLQRPGEVILGEAQPTQALEGHHELTHRVPLQLLGRAVAAAHRPGGLVAGQEVHGALQLIGLPGHPVHVVQLRGVVGDGPQQPVAQLGGLPLVPVGRGHVHRLGDVAQPAEAVVPVALSAEDLRQGGGGRGDQPAGLPVHQGADHQQRAQPGVPVVLQPRVPLGLLRPGIGGPVRGQHGHRGGGQGRGGGRHGGRGGGVIPQLGPLGPVRDGAVQGVVDVQRGRGVAVGGEVGEGEVPDLPGGDLELPGVAAVPLLRDRVPAEDESIGPGHGHEHRLGRVRQSRGGVRGAVVAGHPGVGAPVAEAQLQLLVHRDFADQPLHAAHDLGAPVQGHEVRDAHGAGVRGPHGVQDEGVLPVEALHDLRARGVLSGGAAGGDLRGGRGEGGGRGGQQPAAVIGGAQQRGEGGLGVEPGGAEPVHGAVPGDQGRGAHVREQGVVLDV